MRYGTVRHGSGTRAVLVVALGGAWASRRCRKVAGDLTAGLGVGQ